jgi:hypothetical protein
MKNGYQFKLRNRRVVAAILENGDFLLEYRTLDTSPEPRVLPEHIKGKIHRTTLRISPEAAQATIAALSKAMGIELYVKQEEE